jgi:hypothetical protein
LPEATHPTLGLGAKFGIDACSAAMTGRRPAAHRRLAKAPPASMRLAVAMREMIADIAVSGLRR